MSQTLRNVKYGDMCYSLIFITVTHHATPAFCFLNKPLERIEFKMERWKEFKDHLEPGTTHAFLVHAYSTNTSSGMGFKPAQHLCSFLNQREARAFNSAFLLTYNKLLEECDPEKITDFSSEFAEELVNMHETREHWMRDCERAADAMFNSVVMEAFGLEYPDEHIMRRPWESDIPIDNWEFGQTLFDVECEDD